MCQIIDQTSTNNNEDLAHIAFIPKPPNRVNFVVWQDITFGYVCYAVVHIPASYARNSRLEFFNYISFKIPTAGAKHFVPDYYFMLCECPMSRDPLFIRQYNVITAEYYVWQWPQRNIY